MRAGSENRLLPPRRIVSQLFAALALLLGGVAASLGPALAQTVNNLAPFVRVFTNTLGTGRWFDSYVNDLLPTALGSVLCAEAENAPGAGCAGGGS